MFCKIIFSFLCFTRLFHFANIFFTDLKDMSNKGIKKQKEQYLKKNHCDETKNLCTIYLQI